MVETTRKSGATKGRTRSSVPETGTTGEGRKDETARLAAATPQQEASVKETPKVMKETVDITVQKTKAAGTGKSKAQETVPSAPESVEQQAIVEQNQANLVAFVEANEAIMAGMAALGAEVVGFGTKRLRDNMERTETLLSCRDPEQAFRVQCEFFEQATQHYLEQANQVMTIMTAMTQNFLAPLEERTRETLRELSKEED
jgi:hypothetical protein